MQGSREMGRRSLVQGLAAVVLAGSSVRCTRSGPRELAGELVIVPCLHDDRLRELVKVAAERADGVRAEVHLMQTPRSPEPREDPFLVAPTVEALEQALQSAWAEAAHLRLREGERMLYEAIADAKDPGYDVPELAWRTHLVDMRRALHVREIEGARIEDSKDDGWPRLRIRLKPAEGEAFHRMSAKQVGSKILIVHEDEVLMSPVVFEPIPGHEIQVSPARLGFTTRADAEAQLDALLTPPTSR